MKFVAILSLAIGLAAGQTCIAWVCDPSGVTWDDNCAMIDKNTTQFDIRSGYCSSSQYCPYSALGLSQTATCQSIVNPTPPGPVAIAYPGERCDALHTCIGGNACTNNVCVPPAACVSVQDCGLGKFCKGNTCTAQLSVGATTCVLDTDCVNSAGCDTAGEGATGTCRVYASLPGGAPVQQCPLNGANAVAHGLCASGYCYSPSAGKYACTGTVANTVLPNRCGTVGGLTCQSTQDTTSKLYEDAYCECGYDGYSYCPLFSGDADYNAYLQDVNSFITSNTLSGCNTVRHAVLPNAFIESNYFWCAQNLTTAESYRAMRVAVYPQVVLATNCVVKALNPAYYALEGSSGIMLALGGLLLAFLQ